VGAKIRSTVFNLNNTTGNQDVTISGLGAAEDIKAVAFIVAGSVVVGVGANSCYMGLGFTDGTNHRCMAGMSGNGYAQTEDGWRAASDEVILAVNNAGFVNVEANFVSFIDDGVRINIGDEGATYEVLAIFWAGSDVSAEVGDFLLNSTVNNTRVVTASFEFDHLIAITCTQDRSFNDTAESERTTWNMGLCDNTGAGFNQGCLSYIEIEDEVDGDPVGIHRNNRICDLYNVSAGLPLRIGAGEVTAATSSNFTVTTRDNGPSESVTVGYLIISYGGLVNHWVDGDQASPTSTGNYDITGPGWQPQFVLHGLSMLDTANQVEEDATAGAFAFGAFDEDSEICISGHIEDAAATTDTASMIQNKASYLFDDGFDTLQFSGDWQPWLSNGYRINYTTADSTGRKWIALAVETTPIYEQEGYRWRADDGDEDEATWLALQDADIVRGKNVNTRLRGTLDSSGKEPPTAQVAVQYRKVGDPDSEWRDVPT
jgi:hypothetical protein